MLYARYALDLHVEKDFIPRRSSYLESLGKLFSERNVLIATGRFDELQKKYPGNDFFALSFEQKISLRKELDSRMAEELALRYEKIVSTVSTYKKQNPSDADRLENNMAIALKDNNVRTAIKKINSENDNATSYANLWLHFRGRTLAAKAAAVFGEVVIGIATAPLLACGPIPPKELKEEEFEFKRTELVEFTQKRFGTKFIGVEIEGDVIPVEAGNLLVVNGPENAFQIGGRRLSNFLFDMNANAIYYKPEDFDYFLYTKNNVSYSFSTKEEKYNGKLNLDDLTRISVNALRKMELEGREKLEELDLSFKKREPVLEVKIKELKHTYALVNENGLIIPYIFQPNNEPVITGPEGVFSIGKRKFSDVVILILDGKPRFFYKPENEKYFRITEEKIKVDRNKIRYKLPFEELDAEQIIGILIRSGIINLPAFSVSEIAARLRTAANSEHTPVSEQLLKRIEALDFKINYTIGQDESLTEDVFNFNLLGIKFIPFSLVSLLLDKLAGIKDEKDLPPGIYEDVRRYLTYILFFRLPPFPSNLRNEAPISESLAAVMGFGNFLEALFSTERPFAFKLEDVFSILLFPHHFYRSMIFESTTLRGPAHLRSLYPRPIDIFFTAKEAGLDTKKMKERIRNSSPDNHLATERYESKKLLSIASIDAIYSSKTPSNVYGMENWTGAFNQLMQMYGKEFGALFALDPGKPEQAIVGHIIISGMERAVYYDITANQNIRDKRAGIEAAYGIFQVISEFYHRPLNNISLGVSYSINPIERGRSIGSFISPIKKGSMDISVDLPSDPRIPLGPAVSEISLAPGIKLRTTVEFSDTTQIKRVRVYFENGQARVEGLRVKVERIAK